MNPVGRPPSSRKPTLAAFMAALELQCGFVMMPNGQFFLADEDDLEMLENYKWSKTGKYASANTSYGIRPYAHRIVMNAQENSIIDHKNRNTRDNRKCNLRFCTSLQSTANRSKLSTARDSKYKGVAKKYHRWTARGRVNGKQCWLGQFRTEVEAAAAYNAWAFETFGEFACLNQIPQELLNGAQI